jgi:uncharacterized protein YbgA (DUF1722 family)
MPRIAAMNLFKHHLGHYPNTWLASQVYLFPDEHELRLRNFFL